jgi:hypothetical protein
MLTDWPWSIHFWRAAAPSMSRFWSMLNEVTNPKTKETRLVWQEQGYYGHRLKWAAESALYEAMPFGEPITPQMIRDAVDRIVEATKAHIGEAA